MADIRTILAFARTIAVVGLSERPERDSHHVAAYMQRAGYRIIPVNPAVDAVLGEKSYRSLRDIPDPVDIVDVFRRPEHVGAIVDDAIAIGARCVWMQLGVVNEAAANRAGAAGLEVVMDRCLLIEHARLASGG